MASISSKKRNQLRAWQEAAVSCGLEVMDNDLLQLRLQARMGELWVRIESPDDGQSTRIAVVAPGAPELIVVRTRHEPAPPPEGESETGDPSFDSAFAVEGPAPVAVALLDAETRRLLLSLSPEARLELRLGEFRAESGSGEKLLALLPRLVETGQRLAQPVDVPRCLARNAAHDPDAGVRLQNLLLLIREHGEEPETAEVLQAACSDPSPKIRLWAFKELGGGEHRDLLDLAESLVDDAVSAEAVSLLEQELPLERARAILDRALPLRHLQTAQACLKVLGRGATAADVGLLAKIMEQEKGELATAAAQALGATGSPDAEPPLIPALEREEKGLRMAAVNALARVGTAAAVLPLRKADDRSWLYQDLRRAIGKAIAEIQARIQGASPGQISLAGAEAGQLSIATDPAGQLSLGDEGIPDEP